MKLEKILAENMLRFGVKNLTDELKKKLQEQVDQQIGGEKEIYSINNDDATILGIAPATVAKFNKNSNTTPVETDDAKTNQSTIWRTELVNKFGPEIYTKFIQSLSKRGGNSPTTTENVNIWYQQLTQDSRLAFLTQFNTYISALSKREQNAEYLVQLKKGKITREKTSPEVPPAVPIAEFGIDVKGEDVFIDNQSAITARIQQAIDQLISDITQATKAVEGSDAKVKITSLSVAASASRFRNTGEAVEDTWAQLSQKRAAAVRDSIVTRLAELGITVPSNIITLKGGKNLTNDGTSGPNPPVGYNFSTNGIDIVNDQTKRTDTRLGNNGVPHATKSEYDQYKFLVVTCTAEVSYDMPAPGVPNEVASRGYNMLITAYKKPGTLKLPKADFSKFKSMPSVRIGVSAKGTLSDCMEW
jgi:hypothetical protein